MLSWVCALGMEGFRTLVHMVSQCLQVHTEWRGGWWNLCCQSCEAEQVEHHGRLKSHPISSLRNFFTPIGYRVNVFLPPCHAEGLAYSMCMLAEHVPNAQV